MRLVPGDPARLVMGPLASEQAVEDMKVQMGLNQPLLVQYQMYVQGLLQGDWGVAWHTRQPVTTVLSERLPASIELALFSALIAMVLGISAGAFAAKSAGGLLDRIIRGLSLLLLGTPPFWLGLVLILVLFSGLGLVPAPFERVTPGFEPVRVTGFLVLDAIVTGNWSSAGNALAHLVLPALTLGLPLAAWLAMITRKAVSDAYEREFITAARAKGMGELTVLFRHALPNALLPIITLSTLAFGDLIAGAITVETVFSWPGIGGFVTESIVAQDFAPVQAVVIIGAVTYCVLNLLADTLYAVVDPRVNAR
jgi:peptide/nickel transport system permease protein